MKQILSFSNEYVIETRFEATMVENPDKADTRLSKIPDWINDKKEKANGFDKVKDVCFFSPEYDNNGYATGKYQKIQIPVFDIIKLSEKINEIEGIKKVGVPGDDLPF